MTPPTLNITEETHIIDSGDSLSISCRYSDLSQKNRGLGPHPRPRGPEKAKAGGSRGEPRRQPLPEAKGPQCLVGLPGHLGVGTRRHGPSLALQTPSSHSHLAHTLTWDTSCLPPRSPCMDPRSPTPTPATLHWHQAHPPRLWPRYSPCSPRDDQQASLQASLPHAGLGASEPQNWADLISG